MSDDLDRAIADYQKRQHDKDAGLSDEERHRLTVERARRAEATQFAAQAKKVFSAVASEIAKINTDMAGRMPQLIEVGRGAGNDVVTSVSYGLKLEAGGYDGQTLTFTYGPLPEVVAQMSPPPGANTTIPTPVRLGNSPGAYDFWIRQMIAAFLDRKA